MVERVGKLFGRGTCDMKGFVAATLPLARPLHFAFTYDEEIGCFGAQALAEKRHCRLGNAPGSPR